MPVFPLFINGVKLLLVLGVGLGGHQIYGHIASSKFVDDGFFYFNSKILPTYSSKDSLLKQNKVFNSPSAVTSDKVHWTRSEWQQDSSSGGYMDFDSRLSFRDKLNVINDYDFSTKRVDIYKKIKEHTLKLVMPCQSGTGWLLDFEIPEDVNKYPTKWFIATNLHVINRFRFKDNPYNASLPITEDNISYYVPGVDLNRNIRVLDPCQDSIYNNTSVLDLYTEEDVDDSFQVDGYSGLARGYWSNRRNTLLSSQWPINVHLFEPWNTRKSRVYTTKVQDPKLVYSAVDFLGNRFTASGHQKTSNPYFKDFGVLEVNFTSENQARLMTNGIYEKYYRNIINKNKEAQPTSQEARLPVNFFAQELMSKYDPTQLYNSNDTYFIGGYPGSVSENLSFTMNQKFKSEYYHYWNYSNVKPSDSKLTFFREVDGISSPTLYNLRNSSGEIIPGHTDLAAIDKTSDSSKIIWNGKQLSGWGYNYLINNTFLGSGASGSMVLNQDGELLGLYRMYNGGFNYGFVEPLRGSWVVDEKGRVILPGFDLLSGTGNGVTSYRTQIESKKPNMKSFLRSQNWTRS